MMNGSTGSKVLNSYVQKAYKYLTLVRPCTIPGIDTEIY